MPPEFAYYRVGVTISTREDTILFHADDCGNIYQPYVDAPETRFGSEEAATRAAEKFRRLSPTATVEVMGFYDEESIPF